MSIENLNGKIDQFAVLLQQYNASGNERKELSNMRKAILQDLKEAHFNNEAEKEEVFNRYRELAQVYHEKMEQTNLEQESYADEVHRRMEAFAAGIEKLSTTETPTRDTFTQLRQQADSLFEFIKLPNWPTKELRTKTWEQFTVLRENLRLKEDAFYEKLKAEREEKAQKSQQYSTALIEAAKSCYSNLPSDKSVEAFENLLQQLAALGFTFDKMELPSKEEAIKNPLKTQSELLRDIRKLAMSIKDNFVWEDRQAVYTLLDELKKDQDVAWENYKQEAQRKREERDQKKKEWLSKQNDFLRMLKEKLEKQLLYKEKLEKFGSGQQEFLLRLESRISNQQDYLLKLHDDMDELQKQYDTAWSASFRDRTEERIAGKKDKIASIERDIEDMKQKIKDSEKNVAEYPGRLSEVESNITELQQKIEEVTHKLGKGKETTAPGAQPAGNSTTE